MAASVAAIHRHRAAGIMAGLGNPSTPPVVNPPSTNPSGQDPPATIAAFPNRLFLQDFNVACPRKQFLAAYYGDGVFNATTSGAGQGKVNAFPPGYHDTRSKQTGVVDGKFGVYDPDGLRCAGGSMFMHVWYDPTLVANNSAGSPVTGLMRVSAPTPLLSPVSDGSGGWGFVGSSRRIVRCRANIATTRATTKVAWLGWPIHAGNTTSAQAGIPDPMSSTGFRGGDGEWDWPEQQGSTADWHMHLQNAKSGDSPFQASGSSTVDFFDGAWHTFESQRITGSYNVGTASWVGQSGKFFADGVQVGSTQTQKVPLTPMRWTLQTECTLSSSTPLDTTVDYEIEVDWIVVDTP